MREGGSPGLEAQGRHAPRFERVPVCLTNILRDSVLRVRVLGKVGEFILLSARAQSCAAHGAPARVVHALPLHLCEMRCMCSPACLDQSHHQYSHSPSWQCAPPRVMYSSIQRSPSPPRLELLRDLKLVSARGRPPHSHGNNVALQAGCKCEGSSCGAHHV